MKEHVHDWVIGAYEISGAPQAYPYCIECGLPMPRNEAESRLNATERLSAEDAREIERYVKYAGDQAPELSAYADALEDTHES